MQQDGQSIIRAGLLGGLTGGIVIWIYEALVWVGAQHLMPLTGIPRNAAGLVFGKAAQAEMGALAYPLGIAIHFGFAALWGCAFAAVWPWFRRRGGEATLLALCFAVILWVVMHLAIAMAGHEHPDYLDPQIIVGGIMSHIFFTVPLALIVKARLA